VPARRSFSEVGENLSLSIEASESSVALCEGWMAKLDVFGKANIQNNIIFVQLLFFSNTH